MGYELRRVWSRLVLQGSHRQRQGLIPDLRITIPVVDQPRPVLHELKVISCSQSRYKPSWRDRAVDRRAEALHRTRVVFARALRHSHNIRRVGFANID